MARTVVLDNSLLLEHREHADVYLRPGV